MIYGTEDISDKETGVFLIVIESDTERKVEIDKIYDNFISKDYEIYRYKPDIKWSLQNFREITHQYSKLVNIKKKVIFIEDIDKAERRSYSFLLKSLEENSIRSLFILSAKSRDLPDVILSRVTRTYFHEKKEHESIAVILKKIGVTKDVRDWLIKSKLPTDFILDDNNKVIIEKIINIDKIVNNKKIDIKSKAREIYIIIKEINKYKKGYDIILIKWLNEYLKNRSVTYLFKKDLITGYEKINIIKNHEKNLTYNVNLELYIYSLLLSLAK